MMWQVAVSSFGIAAAILILGGYILLQWQRERHRYALMHAALEKGVTEFPAGLPEWLLSLRQGAAILALGIGLLIVGGVGLAITHTPPPPDGAGASSAQAAEPNREQRAAPTRDAGRTASRSGRETEANPSAPATDRGPGRGPPPLPKSAIEQWHRSQDEQAVSLAAMGCGLILSLLGFVRMGFARLERQVMEHAK